MGNICQDCAWMHISVVVAAYMQACMLPARSAESDTVGHTTTYLLLVILYNAHNAHSSLVFLLIRLFSNVFRANNSPLLIGQWAHVPHRSRNHNQKTMAHWSRFFSLPGPNSTIRTHHSNNNNNNISHNSNHWYTKVLWGGYEMCQNWCLLWIHTHIAYRTTETTDRATHCHSGNFYAFIGMIWWMHLKGACADAADCVELVWCDTYGLLSIVWVCVFNVCFLNSLSNRQFGRSLFGVVCMSFLRRHEQMAG